jgi:hypothetical protein
MLDFDHRRGDWQLAGSDGEAARMAPMGEMDWTHAALDAFDLRLHEHGAELFEARAAGISQARLDALYPPSVRDYYLRTVVLFNEDLGLHGALLDLANKCDMYEDISTRLPWPMRELANNVFSTNRQWGVDPGATRRVLFGNLLMLPLMLRLLPQYPFEGHSGWGPEDESSRSHLLEIIPLMQQTTAAVLERIGAEMPEELLPENRLPLPPAPKRKWR